MVDSGQPRTPQARRAAADRVRSLAEARARRAATIRARGATSAQVRRAAAAAALLAALAATASCAGGAEPAAAPAAPPSVPSSGPVSPGAPAVAAGQVAAPVPEVLSFTARTLDGAPFSGAALAGRPVVLWFWAPWCATCASQAWTVAEVAPRYRDTVPIVGVAGLGEQRAMRDFVTEFELAGVPQLDDRAGALWRRFEVVEQSTFLIVDRDGKVVHQGFLDGEALTARLAQLAA